MRTTISSGTAFASCAQRVTSYRACSTQPASQRRSQWLTCRRREHALAGRHEVRREHEPRSASYRTEARIVQGGHSNTARPSQTPSDPRVKILATLGTG